MSSHDTHADHGSARSYMVGFLLSVVLTALPFAIVMTGGFDNRVLTAVVIVAFAVVQMLVHMKYFLHLSARAEAGWTLLSVLFTVVVVVIMLAGSLWVMYNMNANMMPMMEH